MFKKDRKIANLTQMVRNRDEIIERLQSQKEEFKMENKILLEENKVGNTAVVVLDELYKLVNCNKYSNEGIVFGKIKELVNDYQSTH